MKKLGIGYITLNGEKMPICVRMSTLGVFQEKEGIGSEDLLNMNILQSMRLVYYMLQHGAKKERVPFDATIEDVIDWLDDDGLDEDSAFNQAMKYFGETMVRLQGGSPDTEEEDSAEEKN